MKKFLLTIGLIMTMLFSTVGSTHTAFAAPDTSETTDFATDTGMGEDFPDGIPEAPDVANETADPPEGTNIADPNLRGDGIRISNQFKPINAPDAFNQNYTSSTVNAFLQFIAGSLIEITASVSIFIIVIAGYMFVTAGGDQGRIDKAKEIIKYTIMGMFLIILSFTIVKTVISLLLEVDTF